VRRKDLLSLQAQMEVATKTRKAVRSERLPTLAFDGYYGVLGETTGLYHGVFSATGKLSVPVFEEGQLRGEREVADAQVIGLRQQIESLRVAIEAEIRASMLDVESSNELVKVARSNVALATQELQDATDRFTAGVDDNLPVVQAQAVLAAAQSQLVNTLYQYNQSKLQLARNTGVVESQYKTYLGR
jgi:outer membrane protein TolC